MSNIEATLPETQDLSRLLKSLVGKNAPCRESDGLCDCKGEAAIATYRMDGAEEDALAAVVVADAAFVAYTSAALSLAPLARAEPSVVSGEVDEDLKADANEVFNVCSTLFQEEDGATCRLVNVCYSSRPFADDLEALLRGQATHVEVEIEGYGSGHASLYLVG